MNALGKCGEILQQEKHAKGGTDVDHHQANSRPWGELVVCPWVSVCVCDATEANKTINCKKIRREHQRHALPPHKVCQLIFVDYKNIFILSISFFSPNLLFCCWCCWYRSTVAWILSNIWFDERQRRRRAGKQALKMKILFLQDFCVFDAVHFGGKKIVVKQSSVEQRGIYIGIYIYNQRRLLILLLCSTMHALISCRAKFVYFFFSRFATFLRLPIFLFSFVRFGCCCYIPSGYSDTW